MDRLKKSEEGFTLLELVIAIALSAVVLLSASNLLIHFGKFSATVVRNEASLMGTALGAFEEIVGKITTANEVNIPATNFAAPSIDIRVSPTGAATGGHGSDVFHTYWVANGQLNYKSSGGGVVTPAGGGTPIANDIVAASSSFIRDATNQNHITVTLDTHIHSGSDTLETNKTTEHLVTTAIMRSRSAN